MSLKKSHFLVAGVAIFLGGGLAMYVYFRNLALKVAQPLGSAEIVPASAMMTAFISPNPQALAQLQQLGTPEAQRLIAGGLKEIEEENFAETNISFERDLQPWVGSVTMALVPTDNPENNGEADVLALIGIKNKIKAWNFANKLKDNKETVIKEIEYKNIKIWEVTPSNPQNYSVAAVVGNYLALSDSLEIVKEAIDTYQGEPSLASQADAVTTLSKSAGVKNPLFTLFVPDYGAFITGLNANRPEGEQLSPSALKTLSSVKYLIMGIGAEPGGIRVRAVTKLNTPVPEQPQPIESKLLAKFPTETMALFNGGGISQIWSQFISQAEAEPMLVLGLELMRQGLATTGLDADTEIFGWMDGEFAMGAIASNEGLMGQAGVGGAMLWQTSDRSTATRFFEKLDAIATTTPQVSLKQATLNGKQVTQWQIFGLGTFLGHGWLDEETVFIATGEPIVELMTEEPSNPLDSSTSFQGITGSLPDPNQGYFYLDLEQFVSWLERYPYAASSGYISPETMVMLRSMRGVGITAVWPDAYTSELEMLWAFKSLN